MIRVVFYQDSGHRLVGFQTLGHADYAENGPDILCAAVSALTINTVNSLEKLTGVPMKTRTDEAKGGMAVRLLQTTDGTQLLLQSLKLGLESLEQEHGKHIRVGLKEV